jgi:hypothetical protein
MHHMVVHVVHDVMANAMATFGFHGDCFGAICGGLRVSRGLLGARGGSLGGCGRLLRRTGGSLGALGRGSGLGGSGLRLLRSILTGASSK